MDTRTEADQPRSYTQTRAGACAHVHARTHIPLSVTGLLVSSCVTSGLISKRSQREQHYPLRERTLGVGRERSAERGRGVRKASPGHGAVTRESCEPQKEEGKEERGEAVRELCSALPQRLLPSSVFRGVYLPPAPPRLPPAAFAFPFPGRPRGMGPWTRPQRPESSDSS
ncbi:hypothetical protein AGOR_G00163840 [Albula goreensis]|uniref:Uncharacterized protein n=1 Tax=Albula goreensis TaxID=1534307 RepID=A0A8T3D0N7_9TELE|nr:hypothetical protein AGOR_G00163840 [Albula goreensis]